MTNRAQKRFDEARQRMVETNAAELRTPRDFRSALRAAFMRAEVRRALGLGGGDPNAKVYTLHKLGASGGERFPNALRKDRLAALGITLTPTAIRNNSAIHLESGRPSR